MIFSFRIFVLKNIPFSNPNTKPHNHSKQGLERGKFFVRDADGDTGGYAWAMRAYEQMIDWVLKVWRWESA